MKTPHCDRVVHRDYYDILYYKERIDFVLGNLDEMNDIDDIIELKDIVTYLSEANGIIDEKDIKKYKTFLPKLNRKIGMFINGVTNDNFTELMEELDSSNVDRFWQMMDCNNKKIEELANANFEKYLNENPHHVCHVLTSKNASKKFSDIIYKCVKTNYRAIGDLITYLLEKSRREQTKLYVKETFSPEQLEILFKSYINSERPNINVLKLICMSRADASLGLDYRVKHLAKVKKEELAMKMLDSSSAVTFNHGVGVSFCDNDSLISYTEDRECPVLTYDVKWIRDNLDYATLLNNFIYLFGFVDYHLRSVFPFNKNEISAFEDVFTVKGKNTYGESTSFELTSKLHSLTMMGYIDVLHKYGIDLEQIFKWFFEIYMEEEFSIMGFYYNASSSATYLEKCKNIASEMERVLKQYKLYSEEGYIDKDYYEIGADSCRLDHYRSLQDKKYIYANSNLVKWSIVYLFNNQTLCVSDDGTLNDFDCLYDAFLTLKHIGKNALNRKFQQECIKLLLEFGVVTEEDNVYSLNTLKAYLLKLLYDRNVICYHYVSPLHDIINKLIDRGDLSYEGALFSKPERDYMNYVLNNSEFSNALALRNKYSHGSAPIDEAINKENYIEFLKIMVLVIIKINEEYCLKFSENV